MSKHILSCFLLAAFCTSYVLTFRITRGTPDELNGDSLSAITWNAIYEDRRANIELQMRVFVTERECIPKAENDDQVTCIHDVKKKCLAEADAIREKTTAKLLPAVEAAKAAGNGASDDEIVKKLDYPTLRDGILKECKSETAAWFAALESSFAECLKQK